MTITEDLLAVASIPAPTFDEEERLAWIERRIGDLPGRRRRDEAGNLIWDWGLGTPRILLAAHVDTVFDRDTPLAFVRDGSDLVGPGVGDNAAAVAVAINVVEELLREEELGPAAVVFTVGEEGLGNLKGATAACAELEPEMFIALEGHMLEEAVVDAVGSVRARLTVSAPGGHSWSDRGRPSAVHELLEVGRSLVALAAQDPDAPINIGTIAGGRSVNTIADRAEMVVERRAVDQKALDEFSTLLDQLSVAEHCELAVEIIGRRPGGSLPRDSELFAAVTEVRAGLGLEPSLAAASTDANAACARGIPAVCIGVSRGSAMHSLTERIDLDTLPAGAAQLRALLIRLLGQPGTPTPTAAPARRA